MNEEDEVVTRLAELDAKTPIYVFKSEMSMNDRIGFAVERYKASKRLEELKSPKLKELLYKLHCTVEAEKVGIDNVREGLRS